ncbi:MAG: Hpt domain-containing protein, partial [Pseudobdellovibrionaceae bacterium]|nr:Hpt domain-containing protein [Pseudobdellovibrionaceae bacterium]
MADVYREYAAASETAGDLQQALTYARQALDLAEKHGFPGDILPILIKNDSAILAGRLGDQEQSIALYQQVIDYCFKENIRHMGAIALVNLGRIYIRKDDPASIKKGLTYIDQADVIVKALKQEQLAMFSALVRGEALLNLHEYRQAHFFLDLALEKIKPMSSTIWTADIMHWKARVFAAEKRWAEALDFLQQAGRIFPEHLLEDHASLAKDQAKALFHLGRAVEAYQSAESFIEKHGKIDENTKKDSLNRLQVQFGYKLQEQENQLLKKENQIKEHQLREAGLIKKVAIVLGAMILLVLVLLFFALWQVKKVKQAKAKIHDILDNIEEGIITVGHDLKVESSLSPYLDHVIGHDAPESARQNVMLYLLDKSDLTRDDQQLIKGIISASLDESSLFWELNSSHLPQELHLEQGQRILSLHWQPLYGKDQRIKRILIALRDITIRWQLEREIGEVRAEHGRLQHVLEEVSKIPLPRFHRLMDQAQAKIRRLKEPESWLDQPRSILPDLHTLKGEARTLGLKQLATATHELEDYLDSRQGTPSDPQAILQRIHQWELVWKDYSTFAVTLGSPMESAAVTEESGLLQILAERWTAIMHHCRDRGIHLQRVVVDEEIFAWKDHVRTAIQDGLLHSLTNSIDHGFHGADGQKVDQPCFEIRLQRRGQGMIELTIRDNGRGLDWGRLNILIKERNFKPEGDQTLADVVFAEGVTTSPTITQTSGRGVGLSAIRQIARRLHG